MISFCGKDYIGMQRLVLQSAFKLLKVCCLIGNQNKSGNVTV